MSKLNEVVNRAVLHYTNSSNSAIDPALWALLEQLAIILIEMLAERCAENNPTEGAAIANKPSRIQKGLANFMVRRAIGRRNFRRDGDKLMESLFRTGRELTKEDMEILYNEI